jgi:8-oxo-dGTP pyrophosphatase MutT (NUDIX family)
MWLNQFEGAGMSHDHRVIHIERLELRIASQAWTFALERRADIAAHFARLKKSNSSLFNGRVLLLFDFSIVGKYFKGRCLETSYASLIAWRDWSFPDQEIKNLFGSAVLRSCDGAYLLGVMGPHTMNADQIVFPMGTPDPSDVMNEIVDLEHSVVRELAEETGLTLKDVQLKKDWYAVLAGPRIAFMKSVQSPETARDLRLRILSYLKSEREPEFADIRIVRSARDLEPNMPGFLRYFFDYALEAE